MKKRVLVALVVWLAVVAGCSSGRKSTSIPTTASTAPATVSRACNAAMLTVVNEDPNATIAVTDANEIATLTACKSGAEWLLAASAHMSYGVDHCVVCGKGTPRAVLHAFCGGEPTTPACSK